MRLTPTESRDVRTRVHVRAGSMDGDDLVAYGDVEYLPDDAAAGIRRILADHPVDRYPEGAYIGVFAPPGLESRQIRDPAEVRRDPYPRDVPLTEFPPDEGQFCDW